MAFTRARMNQAQNAVLATFFFHGVLVTTVIPRIPELIRQIGVEFTAWGLIMGTAGLGGLLGLLLTTRFISRFGTRQVALVCSVVLACTVIGFGFVHDPVSFFFLQALNNFVGAMYVISVNSQTVALQKAMNRVIIGKFHAAWSLGTAVSSALSGYLSTFLPLQTHLMIIPSLALICFVTFSRGMLTNAEDGHGQGKPKYKPVSFLKSPPQVWLLSAGLVTGVICEVTMGDWSAVFAQEGLGLGLGKAAIPFTAFSTAMIVGRSLINKLSKRWHLSSISRISGISGGLAILFAILVGVPVSNQNLDSGLVIVAICFAIAGLGAAPMVPSFFSVAGNVKGLNTAQVLARMNLVNSVTIVFVKIAMGATADSAGVVATFMFAVVSMLAAGVIAGIVARDSKKRELESPYPATGAMMILED